MDLDRPVSSAGAGDDERWAQALSILDQRPTQEATRRLRRHRRLRWSIVAGATAVGLAVGVLVFALASGPHGVASAEPPAWREVGGLVVQGVGLLVEIAGGVAMWRAGLLGRGRRAEPAAVLTRAQRKLLMDQVRDRVPADPALVPLTRDLARRLTLMRGLAVLFVGVLLIQVGGAIGDLSAWRTVVAGALVAAYATAMCLIERTARQAERFLAQHPETAVAG